MYAPVQYAKPQLPQGLSVTSLITGIVGLCLMWLPVFGLTLPVLATIFGSVGLHKAVKGKGGGKGMAVAGLVLGVVGILTALIILIVMAAAAASVPTTTV